MDKRSASPGGATNRFEIAVEDGSLSLEVVGETHVGADRVMLDEDDDLTAGCAWADRGFTVEPFLDDEARRKLREGATALIREVVENVLGRSVPEFSLDRYHDVIDDDKLHARVIKRTREGWKYDRYPIDLERVVGRISEICDVPLSTRHWHFAGRRFYLRIIRPGRPDFNPPHRDVWLDFYRHGVNLFFPITACDERTSLPIAPGSHLWKESDIVRTAEGALINGIRFHVPSVVGASRSLRMIRPNPGTSEVMVFSPYLIHGGGHNAGSDTRVSMEMRLWREPGPSGP